MGLKNSFITPALLYLHFSIEQNIVVYDLYAKVRL